MSISQRQDLPRSAPFVARPPWRLAFLPVVGIQALAACSDLTTEPASADRAATGMRVEAEWRPILGASLRPLARRHALADGVLLEVTRAPALSRAAARPLQEPAVLHWNALALELVALYRENPPRAARGYAMLSVAQYDALVALRRHHPGGPQPSQAPGAQVASTGSGAERAALAGASAEVLRILFPAAAQRLTQELQDELTQLAPRGGGKRDVETAFAIGAEIGRGVVAFAATDGSDAVWDGDMPSGPGFWFSSAVPALPPLLPRWGSVRPWLMRSGDQFRSPPPPAFGSSEFLAALAEVRQISDNRTAEQLQIALRWADDPGTATPPGHWNAIAADLIRQHHMPEIRAAWTMALLNMALMDAGISCWDTKYVYWLIRPSQVDPMITTPVPLPNFPSYTSGHSAFSGAAAELLGHVFPAQRAGLHDMAVEAAISRVYGGIHYRFDSDMGLDAGFAIGRLAADEGRRLNPGHR
jgi:membrane-associated phospholipid phosphatase